MSDIGFPLLRRKAASGDPKRIGLWKIGRTIGIGASGRVRIARHTKTGDLSAIKIVPKAAINSHTSIHRLADETEHTQLAVEREIVVMKLIDHPNIMRLHDVWETSTDLYLVLEYVQGGELYEYMCTKGKLGVPEALNYFQQIIGAIDYCHHFNIAHRDLKPENILLDKDLNIKIADFGMAALQSEGMLKTSCGSPHYAAPEIIKGGTYDGCAADIWSCGVILFAFLAARLPFDDEDCGCLLAKVTQGNYTMPDDIDPLAQNLIRRMLSTEVEGRITMMEILAHPFFNLHPPKASTRTYPTLEYIARPIGGLAPIDPDIFANLKTLWHGTPDADIVESLRNDYPTWQKGIYHLLVEYRSKRLEAVQHEDIEIAQAKMKRRKSRKAKAGAATPKSIVEPSEAQDSPQFVPPREGPPTPRRASGRHRTPNRLSSSSFGARVQDLPILSANTNSLSSSPRNMAASPVWNGLPAITVPELQDDVMQAFFNQIVHHLNVLQAKTAMSEHSDWGGSPNLVDLADLSEVRAGGTYMSTPPTTPVNVPQWPARFLEEKDNAVSGSNYFPAPTSHENGTRPLSIRRKAQHTQAITKEGDKENQGDVNFQIVDGTGNVTKRSSLKRGKGRRAGIGDKRVLIIEPTKERTKLKKKLGLRVVPLNISQASSPLLSSNSLIFPTSYGRKWLGNVFKLKPTTFSLMSRHDLETTRNQCRRLLMGMDVRVSLIESEGLGVLRCHLEQKRDPSGTLTVLKPVKFRVEVQRPREGETHLYLVLIQEKGSSDTFAEVYRRLAREWCLDIEGNATPDEVSGAPTLGREQFVGFK